MFEPFRAAPSGAKIANLLILLFLFLSWVSTMVTFGSVLHRLSEYEIDSDGNTDYITLDFYWDHWKVSLGSQSFNDKYSQLANSTACDHSLLLVQAIPRSLLSLSVGVGCSVQAMPTSIRSLAATTASRVETPHSHSLSPHKHATSTAQHRRPPLCNKRTHRPSLRRCVCVCVQIFAFLAFLIHIPLAVSRVAGFSFPLARDTQHSLYIELVLSSIELFCFFLQTTIWGGTCFSPSRSAGSVTGVGYGLIIACFFFLIINELLYFLMRSNDDLVLGNGATRGGGGGGGAYSNDGGGGDYGGDSASQPTFSYQGSGETGGSSL